VIHPVLWTGGWDSTYRVLDLVFNKKRTVQPHYIKDPKRPSTPVELQTMEAIKKMMAEIDKTAGDRVLDTITTGLAEIPIDPLMTNYHSELLKIQHLGGQYPWLASYAIFKEIDDLELCIHRDDKAEFFIRNDVESFRDDDDCYYKLKSPPSRQELALFARFRFPILEMTKLEMERKAKEFGFEHILEKTWFCFSPTWTGKPCGICYPCQYAKAEGMGRRIPPPSMYRRIRAMLGRVKRKWI